MALRRFKPSDVEELKRLHGMQDFDYAFPDLSQMCDIHIIEDDNRIIYGVGAIPTADLYLFGDPNWGTPGMKMEAIKLLHKSMQNELKLREIVQVHAWLPPDIAKSFGNRLMRSFRWTKPEWSCYARKVGLDV